MQCLNNCVHNKSVYYVAHKRTEYSIRFISFNSANECLMNLWHSYCNCWLIYSLVTCFRMTDEPDGPFLCTHREIPCLPAGGIHKMQTSTTWCGTQEWSWTAWTSTFWRRQGAGTAEAWEVPPHEPPSQVQTDGGRSLQTKQHLDWSQHGTHSWDWLQHSTHPWDRLQHSRDQSHHSTDSWDQSQHSTHQWDRSQHSTHQWDRSQHSTHPWDWS